MSLRETLFECRQGLIDAWGVSVLWESYFLRAGEAGGLSVRIGECKNIVWSKNGRGCG